MTASMNTRTWLRDASITGRLRTTVVITIVALTLVAIAYAVSQGLGLSAVRSTTAGVTTYQDLADVQRLMLQARRNEKDFLARKDLAYVRQHKDTMAATFAALARARTAVTDPEQLRQIEQVRAAAAIYQAEFGKATDTLVKVGLDENSGLHGEMRLAAHDVERVTEAANLLPLTVSLLQMRRHEKDFLQRVDSPTSRQTYRAAQQTEYANFRRELESTRADLRPELRTQGQRYYDAFVAIADGYETIASAVQSLRDAAHTTEPALDALKISADGRIRLQLDRQRQIALDAAIGLLAVLVLAAIAIIRTVTGVRAQVTPAVQLLTDTIGRISAGDAKARTKAETPHELGDIGRQMDKMMDEREAINERIARENEQLNNSVIGLLSGAARMSQRDLTVKLPVAEDVTGAVADAINSMAEETAKVLGRVVDVADQVAMSAQAVKSEARTVIGVATTEREAIDGAATQLEAASATMLQIAQLALRCNDAARKAIGTTEQAQGTVLSTVAGIASIRETIRETEKRIKRLGERSQEISGVVNLINSIAERTHILALNASMHAASAGEAGRGFAVVANEVQRLAENARDATSKIGALVNNIQVETADTVVTINDAITKVVSGSDLAERAGAEMRTTRDTTAELVELVQRIAADSEAQASLTTSLRTVAGAIQSSTKQTYEQLQSQLGHTELLVEFSDNLVSSVSVFTLPPTAQVARAAATPAAAPERAAAPRLAPARA